MPAMQGAVETFFGREPRHDVNPDEAVAVGAAIQAAVLAGDVEDVRLLEVTPRSLGIETLGTVMTTLIPKNTTIPTRANKTFSTADDNQPAVTVHVLQGERERAEDNRSLGRFDLDGLPPAPYGTPQIDVAFDIDANGILDVSAADKLSGKAQSITIRAASGLAEDGVQRMIRDAETHVEEDRRFHELVDARNRADVLVHRTRRVLDTRDDVRPASENDWVESAIVALDEAVRGKERDLIDERARALTDALTALEQGGPGTASEAKRTADTADDDVMDVEFEEGSP